MLNIQIKRNVKSYDFMQNPKEKGSFANNWKNNSIDSFILRDDKAVIFECKCQTVANYCFGAMATADTVEYGDTIAPGEFVVKTFVESRSFHGDIHGITRTKDLDGQWINHDAMQTTKGGFQNGRFLIHDRFSFKTGEDTRYAWSAGCFILSSGDLKTFNSFLFDYNVQPGELISGILEEV